MQRSTHKQTLSFLKRRFTEAGFRPFKKFGQNFLIDLNLQQLLVDTARLEPCDVVLEIGTGTGAVTAQIAKLAGTVITVEIDRHLYQLASEELSSFKNVVMMQQDALKNKNRLHPEIMLAVRRAMDNDSAARLKLVANLPYNVATPVISNLLAAEEVPRAMTVTMQKELADRIVARPSTKEYGALSVWVQSQCHAEIVRIMPPAVFWPRPKVSSAIVHIELDEQRRACIADLVFFHKFVRSMFFHRRKFLRSEIASAYKDQLGKPGVDRILEDLALSSTTRAEELDVETMIRLSEAIRLSTNQVDDAKPV